MARRQRLEAVFASRRPDRTPVLGGWIAAPRHIQAVTGATEDEYWADPRTVSLRAYDILGADGLIDVFVPSRRDEFRCVNSDSFIPADLRPSLEETLRQIDSMADEEEIHRACDFEKDYANLKQWLADGQRDAGDMLWMPAQWSIAATVMWNAWFGYENYFLIVGLHPDRFEKLLRIGGANGLLRSRLLARAVAEGLYPRAMLMGEDICNQRGPMISPALLEKHYAPHLRRGLAPLLEAGCKPVWHCDGDCRPILDMLIDCGIQGLQGFQPECGMTLDYVLSKRTREGKGLLIFGPLAVTTELPRLSAEGIKRRVREAIDLCRGRADLVLFQGNTINPDVPLANIRAMYEAVREG